MFKSRVFPSALVASLIPASARAQDHAPWKNPFFGGWAEPVQEWFRSASIMPSVAAVLLVGAVALLVLQRVRVSRRKARMAIAGLRNGPRFRVIDVMCHAVWKGHRMDEDRLQRTIDIARNTTGIDFTTDHMRDMVLRTDRIIVPTNFMWIGDGLTNKERMVIFNATISVLVADGPLTRTDRRFLRVLSRGLRLRDTDLRDLARLTRA